MIFKVNYYWLKLLILLFNLKQLLRDYYEFILIWKRIIKTFIGWLLIDEGDWEIVARDN